jgi:nicotinamide riboside kinase
MSRRFFRGLVVGKFSPLHRGHELLVRRAMAECDEVVILSYSKPEFPGCDAAKREQWLAALFPETTWLVVTDERLREWTRPGAEFREVPANDHDDTTHRRFCGFLCSEILGVTVDAVFTSEDYGDGFAAELTRYFCEGPHGSSGLDEPESGQPCPQASRTNSARTKLSALRAPVGVVHCVVDKDRAQVPVSGTVLRQDIHAHRAWLSPVVYASFVQRVCLLGGESSGKSTLARALAGTFGTSFVPEYGRELWDEKSGRLAFDDMLHIAKTQIEREEQAARQSNRFLFCDTSPLTTLFYSQHLFGRSDPVLKQLAGRSYDLTILCVPDFPFAQDGTRQEASFRARQHEWHLDQLAARGVPFRLVTGPVGDRVRQVGDFLAAGELLSSSRGQSVL